MAAPRQRRRKLEVDLELVIDDGRGTVQRVRTSDSRISIGRGPRNDLVLDRNGVSREHAVVELAGGRVVIRDLDSTNGTYVDGRPVEPEVDLEDGSEIEIGDGPPIRVELRFADVTRSRRRVRPTRDIPRLPIAPFVAVGAIILVALLAIIFVALRPADDEPTVPIAVVVDETPAPTDPSPPTEPPARPDGVSRDAIERSAVMVMKRISTDDVPYSFPEDALAAIAAKIDAHRQSPSLGPTLRALVARGDAIADAARSEGVPPDLVLYTALAEVDGGRRGDPVAAARELVPTLAWLRKTFGSGVADSSLLVVAAYRSGGRGSASSHPLLTKLRKLASANPATQRNVWYLRERGALDDDAYDFVISTLALGVIAQNPAVFGIDAPPLIL